MKSTQENRNSISSLHKIHAAQKMTTALLSNRISDGQLQWNAIGELIQFQQSVASESINCNVFGDFLLISLSYIFLWKKIYKITFVYLRARIRVKIQIFKRSCKFFEHSYITDKECILLSIVVKYVTSTVIWTTVKVYFYPSTSKTNELEKWRGDTEFFFQSLVTHIRNYNPILVHYSINYIRMENEVISKIFHVHTMKIQVTINQWTGVTLNDIKDMYIP